MWPNLQLPADLVKFTEEIVNGRYCAISRLGENFLFPEAAIRKRSSKQVLVKISQYSQENVCVGLKVCNFDKKRLQHRIIELQLQQWILQNFSEQLLL